MKKPLLLISAILILNNYFSFAQSILNGNFENWTNYSFDNLDGYITGNSESFFTIKTSTVSKISDAQNGSFAIKLETKFTDQDTSFGFFINGDPETGDGGVAYSQRPDSIAGYFKYNTLGTDTAILVVNFKKNGVIFSSNLFKIAGNQTGSYKRHSFKLNYSNSDVPDSVIVAMAACNPFADTIVSPGTYIIADNLTFIGSGITQGVPNGNFENWTNTTFDAPNDWETFNFLTGNEGVFSATKTTDKYKGNYALKLEAVEYQSEAIGIISNGLLYSTGIPSGLPFTNKTDTLFGYYKYASSGLDSAYVFLSFYKDTMPVGFEIKQLGPKDQYTMFEMPISLDSIPNRMRIDISASSEGIKGSTLIIDEIQLKSQSLNTSIRNIAFTEFNSYPNPAREFLIIDFGLLQSTNVNLNLYDIAGKQIMNKQYNQFFAGKNQLKLSLAGLNPGVYFYELNTDDQKICNKFIVE